MQVRILLHLLFLVRGLGTGCLARIRVMTFRLGLCVLAYPHKIYTDQIPTMFCK